MVRFLAAALLVVMLALAWRIGSLLSSDAIGMAIGMVLGVLAGVPTAALVLVARRHEASDDRWEDEDRYRPAPGQGYQPPIIVLTGASGYPALPGQPAPQQPAPPLPAAWPPERRERSFRMVGEVDQQLD